MRRIILAIVICIAFTLPTIADTWSSTPEVVTQIAEFWGATQFQTTGSTTAWYRIQTTMDVQSQKNIASLLYLAKTTGVKIFICKGVLVTGQSNVWNISGIQAQ